jgi:hypothetical protein
MGFGCWTAFPQIVRQQCNFSSPGGVREIEDYAVDLFDVGVIELIVVLGKSGGRPARHWSRCV